MSRFNSDDYCEEYPNASELWWANVERAIAGKRGQLVLRDLEAALLELPEKRLIRGHLACDGDVCAVGALVARRRTAKGEPLADVLAELERLTPPMCECGHSRNDHGEGGECNWRSCGGRPCWESCSEFRLSEWESAEDADHATAAAGETVGVTFSLAWRLAYLNDEDFGDLAPEERYERVLGWVRKRLAERGQASA